VLNYLPKSVQPKAKAALHEIWMAETRVQAVAAFEQFLAAFGAKYPKAVECLAKDPPRQNSCRLDRIDEQGAMMRERFGSIRTSIQRQSSGAVAAAGERSVARGSA
jgi:hypothetical protein